MKKIVIGMILGAVLMFSGQAVADSISKVGKRVQAEYVVEVDGVELESMGLAIDGQTTVPARAFGDATGYDVKFTNKKVILTKKEQQEVDPVESIQDQLNVINGDIEGLETLSRFLEGNIKQDIFSTDLERVNAENKYREYQEKIKELQAKKVELEAKYEH